MTPGDGVAVSLSVYTQNILTMTQQLRPRGSFLCEGKKTPRGFPRGARQNCKPGYVREPKLSG